MADTKISALPAATLFADANEFAINEAGTSKKLSGTLLRAAVGNVLISGSSGAANPAAAPSETWQVLTSDATANSTTTIAVVMTTTGLPIGLYRYRYDIWCLSAATSTAHKFNVDYTGTVTTVTYHLFAPSAGVTAATGVIDQEINATTGQVWSHQSTRIDATTLGPYTDTDATTVIHYVIEGVMDVSTSANLTLGHASEVAASSTVKRGTMLQLRRFI